MENPRSEKVAVVDEVTAKLEASTAVIVTEKSPEATSDSTKGSSHQMS